MMEEEFGGVEKEVAAELLDASVLVVLVEVVEVEQVNQLKL